MRFVRYGAGLGSAPFCVGVGERWDFVPDPNRNLRFLYLPY